MREDGVDAAGTNPRIAHDVWRVIAAHAVRAVWDQLFGEAGNCTFGINPADIGRSTIGHALLCIWPTPPMRWRCPKISGSFARTLEFCESNSAPGMMSLFGFCPGEFRGGHDQSDNNSFTYHAHGVPLVIEGGASKVREEGSPSSSWGHSAVRIDGQGERLAGGGYGCSGRILHARTGEHHTVIMGDASE